MAEPEDMACPVTRGELREELAKLEQKFDEKLDLWGGALFARIQQLDAKFDAKFEQVDTKFDRLGQQMVAMEQRLLDELARHVKAFQEATLVQIRVIDDKYADLPGRVAQLEGK